MTAIIILLINATIDMIIVIWFLSKIDDKLESINSKLEKNNEGKDE
jgi:hypothetical protein